MLKWLKALTDSNPGSRVIWRTIPAIVPSCAIFERVFYAFGPSIEGFQHCRPVISIDGTFLYGKYRGKLLIASTWDGDNRLFPLAFAIVEEKTDDYHLRHFRHLMTPPYLLHLPHYLQLRHLLQSLLWRCLPQSLEHMPMYLVACRNHEHEGMVRKVVV